MKPHSYSKQLLLAENQSGYVASILSRRVRLSGLMWDLDDAPLSIRVSHPCVGQQFTAASNGADEEKVAHVGAFARQGHPRHRPSLATSRQLRDWFAPPAPGFRCVLRCCAYLPARNSPSCPMKRKAPEGESEVASAFAEHARRLRPGPFCISHIRTRRSSPALITRLSGSTATAVTQRSWRPRLAGRAAGSAGFHTSSRPSSPPLIARPRGADGADAARDGVVGVKIAAEATGRGCGLVCHC